MNVKKGDRVELVHTSDPYTKLRAGDRGTVVSVRGAEFEERVNVNWDSGSTLSLLPDEGDRFKVLD